MLSNLSLKNNAGTTIVFTKISTKGDTSVFEAAGGSELTGTTLVIKQGSGGKGVVPGTTVRRTLCSLRMRSYNATLGKVVPYTMNFTLTGVVDGTDITSAKMLDGAAEVKELLTAYLGNLWAGEL